MSYTLDIPIILGASQTGLNLKAQLVDSSLSNVGSEITGAVAEVGGGVYLAHLTAIPNNHRGGVSFYTGTLPSGFKAFAGINPQEAEYTDVKTSSVSGGGGGSDALQRTAAIRVSDQDEDSEDIFITIGDSYSTANGRPIPFLDTKATWPDLDVGTVKFYAQDLVVDAVVVTAIDTPKEVKVELTSEQTAGLVVARSRYSIRHVLDDSPDEVETLAQGRVIVKANP